MSKPPLRIPLRFMPADTVHPSRPSTAFRALSAAVRGGLITRGYARLLAAVPAWVWGGEHLVVDTDAGPMCLPLREPSATSLLLWGRLPHEERETRMIAAHAATCRTVIDIGAHSGWYARVMAGRNGGRVVHAFEPNPLMFPFVRENLRGVPGTCQPLAVSDSSRRMPFYRAANANLSSVVRQVGEPVELDAVSLDDFCAQRGIDTVDFVKCDCEGGELDVLRGARRLRASAKPPIWMVEVDEEFVKEAGGSIGEMMAEIHRDAGMRIFTQDAAGAPVEVASVSDRIGGSNVFLVPPSRLTQFLAAAATLGTH
jgi:FkbM family methyltransferase